jgi:hypothetical protein
MKIAYWSLNKHLGCKHSRSRNFFRYQISYLSSSAVVFNMNHIKMSSIIRQYWSVVTHISIKDKGLLVVANVDY